MFLRIVRVQWIGGAPEVLEDMNRILDQDDIDPVALGGGRDFVQQVLPTVGQQQPAHLLVRITAHDSGKGLLVHRALVRLHALAHRLPHVLVCGDGRGQVIAVFGGLDTSIQADRRLSDR